MSLKRETRDARTALIVQHDCNSSSVGLRANHGRWQLLRVSCRCLARRPIGSSGLARDEEKAALAFLDGRQGHPYKVTESVQVWLVEVCRRDPQISSSRIQAELKTTFGGEVRVGHINRVRAQYGVTKPGRGRARTPAKKN